MCFTELNRDRLGEAEAACQRALEGASWDPSIWVNLASVHARARRWPATMAAANRALALRGDHAEARYLLAVSLANSGRFPDAVREARRALADDPLHEGTRFLLREMADRGMLERYPHQDE